jgi:hypothetical protein
MKKIVGTCSACSGNIVEEEYITYAPGQNIWNTIIGPGGKDSYVKEIDLWCDDCGIRYKHLPKKKDDKPKT